METDKEIWGNEEIWAVVHCGPLTFIGSFEGGYESEHCSDIELITGKAAAGKSLRLHNALELTAPWRQVEQQTPLGLRSGMQRTALPSSYGFTVGQTTLHLCGINAICFFCQMEEADRKIYEAYVKFVRDAAQTERAARVGIELAGHGGIRG